MKYLIFNNKQDFEELNSRINNILKNTVNNYSADKYTEPIFSDFSDELAFPISENIENILTNEEKQRLIEDISYFRTIDIANKREDEIPQEYIELLKNKKYAYDIKI